MLQSHSTNSRVQSQCVIYYVFMLFPMLSQEPNKSWFCEIRWSGKYYGSPFEQRGATVHFNWTRNKICNNWNQSVVFNRIWSNSTSCCAFVSRGLGDANAARDFWLWCLGLSQCSAQSGLPRIRTQDLGLFGCPPGTIWATRRATKKT